MYQDSHSTPSAPLSQETYELLWQTLQDVSGNEGDFTQIASRELEFGCAEYPCSTLQVQRYDVAASNSMLNPIIQHSGADMSPDSQSNICSATGSPFIEDCEGLSNLPHTNTSTTVPDLTDYAGDYNFQISFSAPSKETKSTTWTHSAALKKLYVRMSTTCPVRFRTEIPAPQGSIIRAMPVFSKPEHCQEVVKRCPNHANEDMKKRVAAANHLVRCEHKAARYIEDLQTLRHSVLIPYETPQAGSNWVTNLFQFMCLGSCVGGPNRRPIHIVFTLELDSIVFGRRAIEVRICACPGRDRKQDEKVSLPFDIQSTKGAVNRLLSSDIVKCQLNTTVMSVGRKRKLTDDETFQVNIRGRKNYDILCKFRDSLEMLDCIPKHVLDEFKRQQRGKPRSSFQSNTLTTSNGEVAPESTCERIKSQFNCANVAGMMSPDVGLSSGDVAVVKNEVISLPGVPDNTISSWLTGLGLSGYIDTFHRMGLTNLFQLEDANFGLETLVKMKIGAHHRNKIWKALVEWRKNQDVVVDISQLQPSLTASQEVCLDHNSISQNSSFCPGAFEITRYCYKRVISFSEDAVVESSSQTSP